MLKLGIRPIIENSIIIFILLVVTSCGVLKKSVPEPDASAANLCSWVAQGILANGSCFPDVGVKDSLNVISLDVYNRWGSVVYTSPDLKEKWLCKDSKCNITIGTYFYVLKCMAANEEEIFYKATITVLATSD